MCYSNKNVGCPMKEGSFNWVVLTTYRKYMRVLEQEFRAKNPRKKWIRPMVRVTTLKNWVKKESVSGDTVFKNWTSSFLTSMNKAFNVETVNVEGHNCRVVTGLSSLGIKQLEKIEAIEACGPKRNINHSRVI